LAGDDAIDKDYKQPAAAPTTCFRDQEFQVDLFGSFMNMSFLDSHCSTTISFPTLSIVVEAA